MNTLNLLHNRKIYTLSMRIFLLIMIASFSCLAKNDREKSILEQYSPKNEKRYNEYLVPKKSYTTRGDFYQDKYMKYLIGIVGDIINNKDMAIIKETVGFYYDKKSQNVKRLYLGLDIDSKQSFSKNYSKKSLSLFKENLKSIIETIYSCTTVFYEDEIVGMVIGWRWHVNGNQNYINIWIKEDDLMRYEDGRLTLNELIERSTITNTQGKPIRLPI